MSGFEIRTFIEINPMELTSRLTNPDLHWINPMEVVQASKVGAEHSKYDFWDSLLYFRTI